MYFLFYSFNNLSFSFFADTCNWCVPSKIDVSSAPATSTVDYTFRRTSFSWADPILNGHASTQVPCVCVCACGDVSCACGVVRVWLMSAGRQIASTQTNSVAIPIGFNFTYFGTAYEYALTFIRVSCCVCVCVCVCVCGRHDMALKPDATYTGAAR